ncbi:MAG: hypothetical protein HRU38_00205 [Saccharospirillaceae bacterium]|nr:hypothetical protein [Pseudomonadales bacterium]NRB77083.1 hypothetical protein [Saccharospirillaceae bacterium]
MIKFNVVKIIVISLSLYCAIVMAKDEVPLINADLPLKIQQELLFNQTCGLESENNTLKSYISATQLHTQVTSQSSIIYQSFYKYSAKTNEQDVKWQGEIKAVFVDEFGRIREDSNSDFKLSDEDSVVEYLTVDGTEYFQRSFINGEVLVKDNKLNHIDNFKPIWKASNLLNSIDLNTIEQRVYKSTELKRYIFTHINSTTIDFIPSQTLFNYTDRFELGDSDFDVTALINYIRGKELDFSRNREVIPAPTTDTKTKIQVARLGDVVNSALTIVTQPNTLSLLNIDDSYQLFLDKYRYRRNMLYIGANDGMLHAFNAGFTDESLSVINSQFEQYSNYAIGSELWAFIPELLIPKLKKLIKKDYQHQYYVDGDIQTFDVKIFNDDDTHPNGWGTILVFGLGSESVASGNVYPSYYVLDITDPEVKPLVIAHISNPNFNKSSSLIKLVKQKNSNDSSFAWKLAFVSSQSVLKPVNSYVFLYDLKTQYLEEYNTGIKNSYAASFSVVDTNLDGFDDLLYVAVNVMQQEETIPKLIPINTTKVKGKILRFHLNDNSFSNFISLNNQLNHAPLIHVDGFNKVWLFQGVGRFKQLNDIKHKTDDNQKLQNYFVALKEPLDKTFNFSFDEVMLNDLVDTTDVKVLKGGELEYTGQSILSNESNNEILNFDNLKQHIHINAGWKIRLNDFNNTYLPLVLNPPILTNQTLIFEQFLAPKNLCTHKSKNILSYVDFRTGVTKFEINLGGADMGLIKSLIDDAVVINELQIDVAANNKIMLNYTQSGVQIISSNESGSVYSSFIEPIVIKPKRLAWKQLY